MVERLRAAIARLNYKALLAAREDAIKQVLELGVPVQLSVRAIRERLGPQVVNLPITHSPGKLLESFLSQLSQVEKMLLPRLTQRALEQMYEMLKRWSR